jgi:hypothetical protein
MKIESEIIDYFIKLNNLIESASDILITNYYIHHITICKQTTCCLKFHQLSDSKNNTKTRKALFVFMREELAALAIKYIALHDFLIFNYFDKSHDITKYFNPNNFYHVRERHRFFTELSKTKDENKKEHEDTEQEKVKDPSEDHKL